MFPGDIWKAKYSKIISGNEILACLLKFFKNYQCSASYIKKIKGWSGKLKKNDFLLGLYYIKDNVPHLLKIFPTSSSPALDSLLSVTNLSSSPSSTPRLSLPSHNSFWPSATQLTQCFVSSCLIVLASLMLFKLSSSMDQMSFIICSASLELGFILCTNTEWNYSEGGMSCCRCDWPTTEIEDDRNSD